MAWGVGNNLLGHLAPGLIHKNPTTVSWGPNRIDVFAVSNPSGSTFGPRELVHYWWDTQAVPPHSWARDARGGPESLGGRLRDVSPGAASWARERLDVVAVGADAQDGTLQHWWWDGNSWGDPKPWPDNTGYWRTQLPASFRGAPTVSTSSP